MCGSASEGQESATEDVFVESTLSFFLLESLLEVGGGEFEDAGLVSASFDKRGNLSGPA